jgi:hypothetical protein
MAKASMTFTEHPRLLARIAGAFYLIITAFALFAYMHVRGQLIEPATWRGRRTTSWRMSSSFALDSLLP